ncbi:hypothetical protein BD324DRAFT_630100 [Kockovaella imperatae]|uniref:Uncharacterized protein n=1 Tax=Kockovaella imperatae TaxID=4999 RepID=A0A1Y1UEX4_9TREE|nr:hypothetical protein BD324DRAFT_630100 [Kockovaella imperatae]ORX36087.1 hypothetical protein BD324DRAFT_630100 [Kockovaella imperatae]
MPLPPITALFLTHFDDIKGQSVTFYESASPNVLPEEGIEHKTLPSGLHTLTSDLILCTHHGLPCVGVFRSRERQDGGGRGRAMGTLGIVLAPRSSVEALFEVQDVLSDLYDQLEALPGSVFDTDDKSSVKELLRTTWESSRLESFSGERFGPLPGTEQVRRFVEGKASSSKHHPSSYLPVLLETLGPSIVTVYKTALNGGRILLYSPPPLGPVGAFAWCIWAMSLAPSAASDADISQWLGNVGLMDLDEVKRTQGGWIATTSDAIYKSHPSAYDIYIDLSASHYSESSTSSRPSAPVYASQPNVQSDPKLVTYAFSDLPLYRSLLLLSSSPSNVTVGQTLSKSGGLWLVAFELLEKVWRLCVGVCEFAVGRGSVGDIRLEAGEENDPLFGEYDESPPEIGTLANLGNIAAEGSDYNDDGAEGDGLSTDVGEEESIRRGRLVLRQFHHQSYHFYRRLKQLRRGDGGDGLTEAELRELCGTSRWTIWGGDPGSTVEGKWWTALARRWGITA